MPETLDALRDANPRAEAGFDEAVEAVDRVVRTQLGTGAAAPPRGRSRRWPVRLSVALAACTAVALAVVAKSVGPSGAPNAAAALSKAANLSAAAAERSGTAVVRVRHGGELLAGATIRWHGDDVSVSPDASTLTGEVGSSALAVGGAFVYFGPHAGNRWLAFGGMRLVDGGGATTPAEYLASAREDVGGAALKRITGAMTSPATRQLAHGSTVYSGPVKAGLVTFDPRPGGQELTTRMLPFGFLAHGAAADPASQLDASGTVGADGIVRELDITWGTWSYTVAYSALGSTGALAAPKNARPLEQLKRERPGG